MVRLYARTDSDNTQIAEADGAERLLGLRVSDRRKFDPEKQNLVFSRHSKTFYEFRKRSAL
jgi:hypothetical protein